jgi:hypothetical protein
MKYQRQAAKIRQLQQEECCRGDSIQIGFLGPRFFELTDQLRASGARFAFFAGPLPKKPPAQSLNVFTYTYPPISVEAVEELIQRGLFHLTDGEHWRFGDENNGSTRRLDGRNWKRADNDGPDWHKLIGLADTVRHDRKQVLFIIEGSKDALAAAEIAQRCGVLDQVGIMCALGSGYRPINSELEQLRGRRVLLIGDKDRAGEDCANIVAAALIREQVDFVLWNWSQCPKHVKDLYDLLAEFPDHAKTQFSALRKNTFFSALLPSYTSTLQHFNPSTAHAHAHAREEKTPGLSAEEVIGIIYSFIVTERGTGNRQRFLLARAIKPRKLSRMEKIRIHHEWFDKSRPMLRATTTEETSLREFFDRIDRVRYTDSGLEAAWERAKSAKLPFIPARDGDEELALLAAFFRELQRNAKERPFICPVNVVQRLFNLHSDKEANHLIHELEDEEVIKCVERGVPNTQGRKGKPTLWRYKLPMEE